MADGRIEPEAGYSDAGAQVGDRVAAALLDRFAEEHILAAHRGRLALNFSRALDGPQQREGRRDIALADRDSVVPEDQHVLVAEAGQHAAALVGIESDAFEVVIADAAAELGAVEVIGIETAAFHGDGPD